MNELVHLNDVVVVERANSARVLKIAADTLDAMSVVHKIPRRDKCLVWARRHAGEQGRYDSIPPHFDIDPAADHPNLTLAHEVGHFLDNQCLHGIYRAWASEIDPDFEELAACWRGSRLVTELHRLGRRYKGQLRNRSDLRYLKSLITMHELWACTYAQWIAIKTNFEPMKMELKRHIEPTGLIMGEPYSTQWEMDDFRDIMGAVDNLFKKKGWL